MGDLVLTVVGGAVVLVVTGLAIYLYQRSLDKPGGREGLGQVGDVFGGLIDVLEPGHGRAREALRDIENAGPVTPTPEDDDDPIRLLTNPDGTPRAVRIRRLPPAPRPTGIVPDEMVVPYGHGPTTISSGTISTRRTVRRGRRPRHGCR